MSLRPDVLLIFAVACGGNTEPTDPTPGTSDGPTGTETPVPTDTTDAPPTGPDPATVELGATCPLDKKLGEFKVESYDIYSIVDGTVSDAVVPVTILEEIGRDGDCVLLKRNNPFCSPACAPLETCDFGTCVPYPTEQGLGTATVTGLLEAVEMLPVPPGAKYFDITVPHPPADPGALITLTTTGDVYPAVELHGVGVEMLSMTTTDLVIESGLPLVVGWDPPVAEVARAEIWMRLNVDQHGVTPVMLTCVTADDGAFDLSATLIDQLLALGVTGYPSLAVHRRTIDTAEIGDVEGEPGCMEFRVASTANPSVRVEGYTPCLTDFDCPPPLTCNEPIGLCE